MSKVYQIIEYENEDLKLAELKINRNEKYSPVVFHNEKAIHEIFDENIPGEIFVSKTIKITDTNENEIEIAISASNFGRVKNNNGIIKQKIDNEKATGDWLYIEIENNNKVHKIWVYKIIANIWCIKPKHEYDEKDVIWDIHHISNNGFDNRPSNLIWLTRVEHKIIHPWMK
jgi:hypothetical protein